jgi:hypothetical protein
MLAWGSDQERFARTQGREWRPKLSLVFFTGMLSGLLLALAVAAVTR